MYLLDTNACVGIIRNKPRQVIDRVIACTPGEIALSSVSMAELEYGVWKSANRFKSAAALAAFAASFLILPFDDCAAGEYGRIRVALEHVGNVIGPYDIMIAAHAISVGAILVTHNVGEFSRVVGLDYVDWEEF